MVDTEPVVLGIDSKTSIVEQLGKAFLELESFRDASENKVQWKEVEEYFNNLEKLLKKRSDEVEEKEKIFEEKESESRALIAEREAVVAAEERALLDRIQELKDTAFVAILEAREKYKPESSEGVDVGGNAESKVSGSFNGDPYATIPALEENSPLRSGEHAVAVEVQPRPELTQFCEQMDAKGLLNFIMENQKNIVAIREEIPIALKSATEPARFVLDSLERFYPPTDQTTPHAALQGMRRSCVMLMESVAPLLVGAEPSVDHPLSPETKQQAKAIADEWKCRLVEMNVEAANGNSLEAEAFLQLLATFRIASEFDDEEVCKLVLAVAHRRHAPELCRSLGLTHKMPGVIEVLINSGRQIDAVHFVQAFKLTESFPPVPLLKTYLKELRRNSQGGAGGQIDVNAQELAALKVVIKSVEQYKLEAEYPLDPLHKRVAQLEKSKSDRKRMGPMVKHHQPKKARANGGGYYGHNMPVGSAAAWQQPQPVFSERGPYMGGVSERYPQVGVATFDHQVAASQGLHVQQPIDQSSYYYPQDERATSTTSYSGAAASNIGAYVGSGFQPSHQSFM